MIKKASLLALILLVLPSLIGCPGNTGRDREMQAQLWTQIETWDAQGWEIPGWPDVHPMGIVTDHKFRPTRLDIAIKGDDVNPYHQRNMLEGIVRYWQNLYPINLRPRFELRVYLYDVTISNDRELGFTIIDQDGNVETHHGKTQDIV